MEKTLRTRMNHRGDDHAEGDQDEGGSGGLAGGHLAAGDETDIAFQNVHDADERGPQGVVVGRQGSANGGLRNARLVGKFLLGHPLADHLVTNLIGKGRGHGDLHRFLSVTRLTGI